MALYLIFPKLVLFLSLVDKVLLVTSPRSNGVEELESKLVEIKLPLRITSADDLIVWAKNAMRSMASRIDITLATELEEESSTTTVKPADSRSIIGPRDRNKNAARKSSRRGSPGGALVSTYASLFGEGNALAAIGRKEPFEDATTRGDKKAATDEPREPNKLYLPLFLDSTEIVKYRRLNEERGREGTKKYNRESNEASLESHLNNNVKAGGKYSRAIAPKSSRVSGNDGKTLKTFNEDTNRPLISVPFEAVVTITRENVPTESARPGFQENRHPPDEFPPYLEIDDFSSGDANKKGKLDGTKKTRENSQKRQISVLGDLLRILGFGKNTANKKVNLVGGPSRSKGARKPSEIFTPPPPPQFQPEAQRQRRNETSQRQEFDDDDDDDEEESMGSLGSITDLLPLVIPILEDIIDPNTATDLGEILAAALPLLQGLSDPGDEDAPDIIGMIGPILTNILGGKDGQGSDVAAILGPLVTLIAPLIGPVLGPLVGPLLGASSNPVQGGDGGANGSSLASLITAVVGPLVQPTDPGGMSPLSVLVAGVIAALSKELKPGLPGGLDVGALVGAILSGVIAGASAGLSGTLSGNDPPRSAAPYGPAGPLQAGSINTGTSAGFHAPGLQQQHHHHQQQQGPIHTAGNVAAQQKIVHQTIHRPYSTLPQNIPASTQARPPPTNYAQHFHAVGPLQAGTNDGGSSYLPYGTNAVPANSVNPIGLIGSAIKDVLGAGIQVVSTVINAVFGIIGGSSAPEEPPPRPVYGPPAQGYS